MMWRNLACYITKIINYPVLVLTFISLLPSAVFALGIGGIKLDSTLDQPLNANIEILGVTAEDLAELDVNLASDAIYKRMGIERSGLLERLKFTIKELEPGKHVIHVSTDRSISEPFLNFLIEVNWRNGRLLREFTVLLDPPVLLDEEAPPVSTPEAELPPTFSVTTEADTRDSAIEPMMESPFVEADSEVAPESEFVEDSSEFSSNDFAESEGGFGGIAADQSPSFSMKVQKGDYLYKIANEIRPANVSVDQMMLALKRHNPDAFFGDNVNMLKAGAVLRLDNLDDVNDVSLDSAVSEVARQHQDWLAYRRERQARNAVAASSAESRPLGSDTSPSNQQVAQSESTGGNLLELVSPVDKSKKEKLAETNALLEASDEKLSDLNVELTLATEATEASKRENEELQNRVSALDEQMTAMKSLIQLKDEEFQKLGDSEEGSAVSELLPTLELDMADDNAVSGSQQVFAEEDVVEEEELIDSLLKDPVTLGTIAGIIFLVLLLVFIIARKRNKAEEEEFTDHGEKTLGELFAEDDAEFETDDQPIIKFNESVAEMGDTDVHLEPAQEPSIDTGELLESKETLLDPLAEADVYLTYEKYEKAENLLKAAIAAEPNRNELKLKLLEVYALSHNVLAFNNEAENLYEAIAGDDEHPLWQQAQIIADDIGSTDPLFQLGKAAHREAASAVTAEADSDMQSLYSNVDDSGLTELKDNTVRTETTQASSSAAELDDLSSIASSWEPESKPDLGTSETAFDNTDVDSKHELDNDFTLDIDALINKPLQETAIESVSELRKSELEQNKRSSEQSGIGDDVQFDDTQLQQFGDAFTEDALIENPDSVEESEVTVSDVFESADKDPVKKHATGAADDVFGDASLFLLSDEVGTKLDLAKAYIEMGDHSGAKDLLTEVMDEGNSKQKEEAQELIEVT